MLYARIVINIIGLVWEVLFVKKLVGLNLLNYTKEVIKPISIITITTIIATFLVKDISTGIGALIITTTVSIVTLAISTYLWGMNLYEKNLIEQFVNKYINRRKI